MARFIRCLFPSVDVDVDIDVDIDVDVDVDVDAPRRFHYKNFLRKREVDEFFKN